MNVKADRGELLRRWWGFANSERALQYLTYIAIFLLLNTVALSFGIARLITERDMLYAQRDVLPQRDISQWQRQTFKLINLLASEDAPEHIEDIELNVSLAESRIGLIRVERVDFLAPQVAERVQASSAMWFALMEQLDDWKRNPQDDVARALLVQGLTDMELVMNEALTDITVAGLDLNTRAQAANSRLLLVIGAVAASIVLAVIIIAAIGIRMARRQLQTMVEKDSMRKFADQSPFPILRFAPDHKLLYANPASAPLEQLFDIRDGKLTNAAYTAWLDGAFEAGAHANIEAKRDGRTYSLLSAPVAGERAVTIYGFDVTDLKEANLNVRRQVARLSALHTIDEAIASTRDLRNTLDVLLDQTSLQLGVAAAAIFITQKEDDRLLSAAFQGYRMREMAVFSLRHGESLAGRVAQDRQLLALPDLENCGFPVAPELLQDEGFRSYYGIPLEVRGELVGVLEIFQRSRFTPDDEWLEFFRTLAGQAAIALDNAQLFDDLRVSNDELRTAYDTTLEGWAKALELRDKETEGHSRRVTELTMLMAREIGIPEAEWDDVRRGAVLHDIGKMGVPDEILLKPGKLDEAEWAIMKRHTEYAFDMLAPIPFLQSALDIPYYHHEKWDGSGYPRGRSKEQIPLSARVFAIVDVWDALRSDRPYRPAWSKEETLAHIRQNSGTHFDPQVAEVFVRLVEDGKIG